MKKFLKNLIEAKEKRSKELREKINAATTADEVRSLGNELTIVDGEIAEARSKLNELDAKETEEARSAALGQQFNPVQAIASTNMNQARSEDPNDSLGTMEYRTAFMNYIQRGETSNVLQWAPTNPQTNMHEQRASSGTSADLGVLIPSTVIQEIIKGVEKVYGQLYSEVTKTNVPGGVKYPIGSFKATYKRITETTVSERQHAGEITGFVQFTYNIGEIRLARTLLQTVLSVPVFEQEFAKVVVEAYVEGTDKEIIKGNPANHEMSGILSDPADGIQRIPTTNIITFTAAEMADWTTWQKKLFAKIPLSMRGLRPKFVMTPGTFEANIMTLKDNNNRPVYQQTYNPVTGDETAKFDGKLVTFVEDDILKNFDDAANNEYFGMYWVGSKAYAINSNLQFSVVDYFDQETNQYVKKAVFINDGKILDPKYIYLLKKSVTG